METVLNWFSNFMGGYKAKIAGVGLMLAGAGAMIGAALVPDWVGVKAGFVVFMNGLGVFGIRAAVDGTNGQ